MAGERMRWTAVMVGFAVGGATAALHHPGTGALIAVLGFVVALM